MSAVASAYWIPFVDCPECDNRVVIVVDRQAGEWARNAECDDCGKKILVRYDRWPPT